MDPFALMGEGAALGLFNDVMNCVNGWRQRVFTEKENVLTRQQQWTIADFNAGLRQGMLESGFAHVREMFHINAGLQREMQENGFAHARKMFQADTQNQQETQEKGFAHTGKMFAMSALFRKWEIDTAQSFQLHLRKLDEEKTARVNLIRASWPLKIDPESYTGTLYRQYQNIENRVPLQVITSEILTSDNDLRNRFSGILLNVRDFFDKHYELQGDHSMYFYSGGWREDMPGNNAQVFPLAHLFQGLPTLVLLPDISADRRTFSVRCCLWGHGKGESKNAKFEIIYRVNLAELNAAILRHYADELLNGGSTSPNPVVQRIVDLRTEERQANPDRMTQTRFEHEYEKIMKSTDWVASYVDEQRTNVLSAAIQLACVAMNDYYFLMGFQKVPKFPSICREMGWGSLSLYESVANSYFKSLAPECQKTETDRFMLPWRLTLVALAFSEAGQEEIAEKFKNRAMEAAELIKVPEPIEGEIPVLIPAPNSEENERKVFTIQGVEFAFRWCPKGTFNMGSPMEEVGRNNNEWPHEVTLTEGFWILETPVTQEMWMCVLQKNQDKKPISNSSSPGGMSLPMTNVEWKVCEEWIAKLNGLGVVPGFQCSLPTEAQWEYACRAGTETAFNNGKNLSEETRSYRDGNYCYDCSCLNEVGWYKENNIENFRYYNFYGQWTYIPGTRGPYPVRQKSPNFWNLYDMHGNVWELCLDKYNDYDYPGFPELSVTDPIGPTTGSYHVIRGGDCHCLGHNCRSASRDSDNYCSYRRSVGFRLVLVRES